MEEQRRTNDSLILLELKVLSKNHEALAVEVRDHIKKNDHQINGNGTPGLKETVAVLKSRVALISLSLLGAWATIMTTAASVFTKGS